MRTRLLLTTFVLTVVALGALAAPAAAGGWAVTTLDEGVAPVAGEPFDVGFTIRQHGRTPVLLAGVLVETQQSDGSLLRFTAVPEGPTGHYVATIRLPQAGEWTWRVIQGEFAPQELGTLTVTPASSGGSGGWRSPLPVALGVLALVAIAAAVVLPGRRATRPVGV